MRILVFFLFMLFFSQDNTYAQNTSTLKMGLLKYNGGGDWYSNPTALPNLAKFCNQNLGTNFEYGLWGRGSRECRII